MSCSGSKQRSLPGIGKLIQDDSHENIPCLATIRKSASSGCTVATCLRVEELIGCVLLGRSLEAIARWKFIDTSQIVSPILNINPAALFSWFWLAGAFMSSKS